MGVAVLVVAAVITAFGVVRSVRAGVEVVSSFVPITPCRLADTRPGGDNVGERNAKIGAAESVTFAVWGTNGNCTIPVSATGISTNITAVGPTAASFLTVWPADAVKPTASSLNVVAGSPPTPNGVTVSLSADGRISVFNLSGSVDVIIDIVGYYTPAAAAGAGPAGPTGPTGPAGATGPAGPAGEVGASGPRFGRSIVATKAFASAASDGWYTSIAIGTDGFPVIAHYDDTNKNLHVMKCTTVDCSTSSTAVLSTPGVADGKYTSIAIGGDGRPLVSYYNESTQNLELLVCPNVTCAGPTSANVVVVDSSANIVGQYTSIAVAPTGFPYISYYDQTANQLKLAQCLDSTCATRNITLLSTAGGTYTSLAIGTNGYPFITATIGPSGTGAWLYVACLDAACTTKRDLELWIDATYNSVAIGTDGYPVFAYFDVPSSSLWVSSCRDEECSTIEGRTIATAGFVGTDLSLAIGVDGNPVIAYKDGNISNKLRLATCVDPGCAATPTIIDLDTGRNPAFSSITITPSGNPIIAYQDYGASDLVVAAVSRTQWTALGWSR